MNAPALAPALPANYEYQNDRVIVIPYSEKHTSVFPETFLPSIYFKLQDEGTLDVIFPGMNFAHLNRFMFYMANPGRLGAVISCLRNPDGPPHPVGFGWLCEFDQGRASFGFGFFKEVWANKKRGEGFWDHADLSMLMLAWWFHECNVQVLYGTTLNPIALNYSKKFGFQKVGDRLPKFFSRNGGLVDAHLIVLEKENFLPYYERWKERRG